MNKYGAVAEIAVQLLAIGKYKSPREAWNAAGALVFEGSRSSREKSCPRDAFLSLCGVGAVEGVPAREYTRSKKNRTYVLRALAAPRDDPALIYDEKEFWQLATNGANTRHNSQLDVLAELWRRRWLR